MATQIAADSLAPAPIPSKLADPGRACAAHTSNFPALLNKLGALLLVTTYQAGELLMGRDEGIQLNTHYTIDRFPQSAREAAGFSSVPAWLRSSL